MIDDEGGVRVTVEPHSGTEAVAEYDAGDLSCGELLIELRKRMLALLPGEILAVTATDPAAPLDIPAWCFTTGHALVEDRHPRYRIRRRKD